MRKHSERLFWSTIVIIPLAVLGIWAVDTWLVVADAADGSAQAALDKEIYDQLAAIPPGQSYPDSLFELNLTYPDGGDSSLLDRFEYHSTGQSCTQRTILWDKEIVHTFPVTK